MKKCFYVLPNTGFECCRSNIGVYKKILSQISFFERRGYLCKIVNLVPPTGSLLRRFLCYFSQSLYKQYGVIFVNKDISFIYIRHILPVNIGIIALLKKIKENDSSIKIIYEIPTYPYDKEIKGLNTKVKLIIDKFFRVKLRKYVDIIITYSDDKKIWGIPTLQLQNGVDCSSIPVVVPHDYKNNQLRLIAVAQFSLWHGYDRLLEGIYLYKNKSGNKYNIGVDFVGDGPLLNAYQEIVDKYGLNEIVYFHGLKSGQELTDIFNNADIAVCSLGCHRINVFKGSFLKSREYLARGLPIVTSTKIDVVPDDFPYCLRVPEDDSPIDIDSIISFFESKIKFQSQEALHIEIRKFAEKTCDMNVVMDPIIDFVESTE